MADENNAPSIPMTMEQEIRSEIKTIEDEFRRIKTVKENARKNKHEIEDIQVKMGAMELQAQSTVEQSNKGKPDPDKTIAYRKALNDNANYQTGKKMVRELTDKIADADLDIESSLNLIRCKESRLKLLVDNGRGKSQ